MLETLSENSLEAHIIIKQKFLLTLVLVLAVLLAVLLAGTIYILFPEVSPHDPPVPLPFPEPEALQDSILWAVQLIVVAACAAMAAVGALLLVQRVRDDRKHV